MIFPVSGECMAVWVTNGIDCENLAEKLPAQTGSVVVLGPYDANALAAGPRNPHRSTETGGNNSSALVDERRPTCDHKHDGQGPSYLEGRNTMTRQHEIFNAGP